MNVKTVSGRTQTKTPNITNPPLSAGGHIGSPTTHNFGYQVKVGDFAFVKCIEFGFASWWPGKVTSINTPMVGPYQVGSGLITFELRPGAPQRTATLLLNGHRGVMWKLREPDPVDLLPLTGQGVRNLDLLAPPSERNGRHFRKPKHWIAICPHPEEYLTAEKAARVFHGTPTTLHPFGEPYEMEVDIQICEDCGAELG